MKTGLLQEPVFEFPEAEVIGCQANDLLNRNEFRPGAQVRHRIVTGIDALGGIGIFPIIAHISIRQIKAGITVWILCDSHSYASSFVYPDDRQPVFGVLKLQPFEPGAMLPCSIEHRLEQSESLLVGIGLI